MPRCGGVGLGDLSAELPRRWAHGRGLLLSLGDAVSRCWWKGPSGAAPLAMDFLLSFSTCKTLWPVW